MASPGKHSANSAVAGDVVKVWVEYARWHAADGGGGPQQAASVLTRARKVGRRAVIRHLLGLFQHDDLRRTGIRACIVQCHISCWSWIAWSSLREDVCLRSFSAGACEQRAKITASIHTCYSRAASASSENMLPTCQSTATVSLPVQALPMCLLVHFTAADLEEARGNTENSRQIYDDLIQATLPNADAAEPDASQARSRPEVCTILCHA